MRDFFKSALKRTGKLAAEQMRDLLISSVAETERLESVLDSLNEGILVCDTNHTLVMANRRAERYYLPPPRSREEGAFVWTFAADEKVRAFLESALVSGDRVEGREFNVELAGKARLLAISVLPLVRSRQVEGSLVYIEDITERRGKEVRLRRAENLASLTTLAAGVAHEIKNPLGSISIHVQLIQRALSALVPAGEGELPDGWCGEINHYIGVVNEEIARLNHIVVDFLFAVRPMNLEPGEADINSVISGLVEFVRYELEEAHISFELDLKENIPLVPFDERYMKQALLNLIKNAIAAMPDGGILSIVTASTDAEVTVTVRDTGTGISEENMPKIFEPYFTTKESGSGLGLTLVYKIVREHRGEVSVNSREGEGTAFTITLPLPQKETRLIGFTENAVRSGPE